MQTGDITQGNHDLFPSEKLTRDKSYYHGTFPVFGMGVAYVPLFQSTKTETNAKPILVL